MKELEEAEIFHGNPIAEMVEEIFAPTFHELEEAVKSGNSETAVSACNAAPGKCNERHQGASHDHIVIEHRGENFPLQNFAPRQEAARVPLRRLLWGGAAEYAH